jgi:hypothetical protein
MSIFVVAGAVVLRSVPFLVFEGLNFNADEAVYGIMALHLLEGRAFPLFTYGQGYILAVSVLPTLALLPLVGSTLLALRLPMLGYNVVAAALLVAGLSRDARLPPRLAAVASVPFALAAPAPTAHLFMHVGGNVEPFVWILLLWTLRGWPILVGLVAGVGFLNREFTAYGLVGLAVVGFLDGRYREWWWWRRVVVAAAAFGLVLAAVAALKPYSTYASEFVPGFGFGSLGAVRYRLGGLLSGFLPTLGGGQASASGVGPAAPKEVGHTIAPYILLSTCGLALAAAVARGADLEWRRARFPVFLIVVGSVTLLAYVLVGRGSTSPVYVRYVLLALLLPVGLSGLAFTSRVRWARPAIATALVLWGGLSLAGHARLLRDCLTSPPPSHYHELIAFLEGRGFVTGLADYWTAYPIDYLSGERLKIAGAARPRILEYRTLHRKRLERGVGIVKGEACVGGTRVARWCVVGPPGPSRMREARAWAAGEARPPTP